MEGLRRFAPLIGAGMLILTVSACTSGPPKLPYPAFVVTDELLDTFLVELPGVRAKRFTADAKTRSGSYRIDLPPDWQGTSGASPGKSLEIFVLRGELTVADFVLRRGGYAYLPSGTLGFNLKSSGAQVLYFIDDADPAAMIRTPIILESRVLPWDDAGSSGLKIKDLRKDPGSGARTWLLQIEPGASIPWQTSSASREGYLVEGEYRHSECVDGKAKTWTYPEGGYFYRPSQTINGGAASAAIERSIWILREAGGSDSTTFSSCTVHSAAL